MGVLLSKLRLKEAIKDGSKIVNTGKINPDYKPHDAQQQYAGIDNTGDKLQQESSMKEQMEGANLQKMISDNKAKNKDFPRTRAYFTGRKAKKE